MSALMPVGEAQRRILDTVTQTRRTERRPLLDALHCVLAEDIVSPLDVPGADNSAMDGYALRASDAGAYLPVSQRIPAGHEGQALAPGTAARIFTGASVPPGADAVAMQENCTVEGDTVRVDTPVRVGDHVRPRGQDIARGAIVLAAGRRLQPQDLGLLASVGCAQVPVFRPLTVAVLSTGDELVEPGTTQALAPGQLYNSNRFTLAGLLRGMNLSVFDGGIVADTAQATAEALALAADKADCIITSGGVSVGEEDHVKAQVEQLGQLALWKLAIKPGKPLAFGQVGDTPFFGLPGNPSSVFVTFTLVARPYLLAMQGASDCFPTALPARAAFSTQRPGGRQEYLRVMLERDEGGLLARRYPNQSSGVLSSVSHSNALAVIPPGVVVAEGDEVEVLPLSQLTA